MLKLSSAQTAYSLSITVSHIPSIGNPIQAHSLTTMYPPKWRTCDYPNDTTVCWPPGV